LTITSHQPTGLSGLMSRAEDKGKGKGKGLCSTCTAHVGYTVYWMRLNATYILLTQRHQP